MSKPNVGGNFRGGQLESSHMHINPDHFLKTPDGRVWTHEANARAWQQCHLALEQALRSAGPRSHLFLMVGAQGSGKSTWARRKVLEDPDAIIFDAILVRKSEREPLVAAAVKHGVSAVAVWFRASLSVCLERNAARPRDEVADEGGLRNVHAALEPPTEGEGFTMIIEVSQAGD